MDYLKSWYQGITIALTPVGRISLLPYVLMRVWFQWIEFISLLALNHLRVIFIYYFNYIFMVQDPNSKSLSTRMNAERQRLHNQLTNSKRPIKGDEAIYMFDPPESLFDVFGYLQKSWARTDYYWDRYFIHTPFCIVGRLTGQRSSYVYVAPNDRENLQDDYENGNVNTTSFRQNESRDSFYFPQKSKTSQKSRNAGVISRIKGLFKSNEPDTASLKSSFISRDSRNYSSNETLYQNISEICDISTDTDSSMDEPHPILNDGRRVDKTSPDGFEPRPYNLQPPSKEGSPKRSPKPVTGASPLKELFKPPHFYVGASKSPIEAEVNSKKVSDNSTTDDSKVLYKIRIRKKSKRKDLTLNNYDLVKQDIVKVMDRPDYDDGSVGPNILRFTWHCCATYDKNTNTGGSNGATMRFPPELTDPGNTGLHTAKACLDLVKHKFEWITYSDLYTLAGVVVIEALGGPKVPWKPGRIDCVDDSKVPPNGRLPVATLGIDHVKDVFIDKLGFNIQETVALIGGGHTLGRCHAQYSGFKGKWTNDPVRFDNEMFKVLLNYKWHETTVPETKRVQFEDEKGDLMMLNTDMAFLKDEEFKKWCGIYANDKDLFFKDFSNAFAKLLELGVVRETNSNY